MKANQTNTQKSSLIFISNPRTIHPDSSHFMLHNHRDSLEILIFISGDAEFRVEGSVYPLHPFDAMIVSDHEMHRMVPLSDTPYERIIINVPNTFFVTNNCEEYTDLFFNRTPGEGNLISHTATEPTRFRDCITRLMEYYNAGESETLIKSVLIELFHILNKCRSNENPEHNYRNRQIKDVITYINENLTSDITLENISERFFINKSYLCRAFKQHTGYTLNKYITHKRILYVRELCSRNMSITQASLEAGFGNYSNFYRMYRQETGQAPSQDLK